MFFNKTFRVYRQEKSLLIKEHYTKEELENLYEEVYIFNLHTVLGMDFCRFKWFEVSELRTAAGRLTKDFTEASHNSFLKDMEDKTLLAKELMELGMYIHLVTNTIDGKPFILSGGHRTISAQILDKDGKWNGKKLIAIDVDPDIDVRKKFKEYEHEPFVFEKEVMMRVPITFLFSKDYKDVNEDYINNCLKEINGTLVTPEIVEFPVKDNRLFFRVIQMVAYWLAEAFYIHRSNTGEVIQPHPVLNDIKVFESWSKK